MCMFVDGGVAAPIGFSASGVHSGIRKNKTRPDLALILSDRPCTTAAVYTTNQVKSAPIYVTMDHLRNHTARAVICNSGNANACDTEGRENALRMCQAAAAATGISPEDVIVASTGVIGVPLPIQLIEKAGPALAAALDEEDGTAAATAIMTTDTVEKQCAVSFVDNGRVYKIGATAKGTGMIHPNMATMLCFITTDAEVEALLLDKALRYAVEDSFHMISVDGDTSTNDMVTIMANGASGVRIMENTQAYEIFLNALSAICVEMAKMMVADGEGATKLIECHVTGAAAPKDARTIAKSIICSSLVKTALFGADANWGRVLAAIGYAGCPVDVGKIDISFGSKAGIIPVCKQGLGIFFNEKMAKKILSEDEVDILVDLHDGEHDAIAYGCDLTYEYVKINGEYRT